jgi:DNA-binding winged helix-turn-helix (wHTH) protein
MGTYCFGEFTLDMRSGELRRGAYRVRLRPQPAALLEYLVSHAGEVVTREDLRRVLWPAGTFVHFDHGLNSCIKQLRAALLDNRSAPRYLETLPRRGYRFIAAVGTNQEPEVDYSVSGTVRRQGQALRISLELTDPVTHACLWAAEFNSEDDDVRTAQSRMADEIVRALRDRHSSPTSGGSSDVAGFPALPYFAQRSGIG